MKVPAPDESQEEQESGSETSDSVCNGGQSLNTTNGQNVTLITLNAEGTVSFICNRCMHLLYTDAVIIAARIPDKGAGVTVFLPFALN